MKKLLSLVLALIMVLSVAAFASAEDEEIELTWLVWNDPYFPTEISRAAYDNGANPETVKIFDEIENLLPGYKIHINWLRQEDADIEANLSLYMAAGDIPDIFVTNKFNFMQYYNSGLFIEDLNPLVDQYGPNLRKYIEPQSFEYCTVNGKLAAIPAENYSYKHVFIVRMDWIRNLGFEEKDSYTISELAEIARAMATKDPDGDGKDNTFGIGCRTNGNSSWNESFMAIFGAFGGVSDQDYVDENGVVEPFNVSDNMRAALEYLIPLYKDHAIDPEVFTLNTTQATESAANGHCGMYNGWWSTAHEILRQGLETICPEADFRPIYVTSDDGTVEGIQDEGSLYRTVMIPASCKHPEAVVALGNYFLDYDRAYNAYIRDENGDYVYEACTDWSGMEYTADDHNQYTRQTTTSQFYKDLRGDGLVGFKDSDDQLKYGIYLSPFNIGTFKANKIRVVEDHQDSKDSLSPTAGMQQKAIWYIDQVRYAAEPHPLYQTCFYGMTNTDEKNDLQPGLDTCLKDWVVRFVTGETELNDANWAAFKADYVKKGGQTVLDSMVKAWNETRGTTWTAKKIAE